MSRSGPTAAAYPTADQYDRWKARKTELGYKSISEFMQAMIEAGIRADKGFETSVTPDESSQDLRRQRNELKADLDRARGRIQNLEEQVFYSERETLRRFVEEHPGVSYEELVAHLRATVPERMSRYLDGSGLYADRWEDENGNRRDGYFLTPEGASETHAPE